MTNINSTVQPKLSWASRLGASSLRVSFPGTGVLVVASGMHALPRVRDKVAFAARPRQADAVATQLGQTNIYNYMTGVTAVGEGASGPPRGRKPV